MDRRRLAVPNLREHAFRMRKESVFVRLEGKRERASDTFVRTPRFGLLILDVHSFASEETDVALDGIRAIVSQRIRVKTGALHLVPPSGVRDAFGFRDREEGTSTARSSRTRCDEHDIDRSSSETPIEARCVEADPPLSTITKPFDILEAAIQRVYLLLKRWNRHKEMHEEVDETTDPVEASAYA